MVHVKTATAFTREHGEDHMAEEIENLGPDGGPDGGLE
jgi:hypothetical protein